MRAFKIVMMGKEEIRIESEEIHKVLQAIKMGSPAILKQGIFNPSSYSCIIEDTKREKVRLTDEVGHHTGESGFEKLPNIFEGVKEVAMLMSSEVKRLD